MTKITGVFVRIREVWLVVVTWVLEKERFIE